MENTEASKVIFDDNSTDDRNLGFYSQVFPSFHIKNKMARKPMKMSVAKFMAWDSQEPQNMSR